MAATRHSILDNKVQVYLRPRNPHWNCSFSIGGRQFRHTTREESLAKAKDIARDLYLTALGKYRDGGLKKGKLFKEVAERFLDEFEVITQGQRSPIYVKGHRDRVKNHLNPFFGDKVITEITPGLVQDYRIHRMKNGASRADQFKVRAGTLIQPPKPLARSTLHQEIVCLRQTSVEMIETYYASHIKNTLDAAAINVRKTKRKPLISSKDEARL